jgi:hypothetical protein
MAPSGLFIALLHHWSRAQLKASAACYEPGLNDAVKIQRGWRRSDTPDRCAIVGGMVTAPPLSRSSFPAGYLLIRRRVKRGQAKSGSPNKDESDAEALLR